MMIPDPDAYPEQILAAAQNQVRALERRQRRLEARRAQRHAGPWSRIRSFNRLRRPGH